MTNLFSMHLLMGSFISSILIIVIFIVRKMFKNHISAKWQYGIWFFLLVILIMPLLPQELFSFIPIRDKLFYDTYRYANNNITAPIVNTVVEQLPYGESWMHDFSLSVNRNPLMGYVSTLFLKIWPIGIAIYGVLFAIWSSHLKKIKKSTVILEDQTIISLFEKCKKELHIAKKVNLGKSSLVDSPMAFGLSKTYILLPDHMISQLSIEEMQFIFLHELSHYKNKDIWTNYLLCILQVIYWFNPFVYWAFKAMRIDREIACDRSVLKRLEPNQQLAYGRTIISCAERLVEFQYLKMVTSIGGSKEQIKERIEKIALFKKETKVLKVKSIILFIVVGILTLSQIAVISVMAQDNNCYYFQDNKVIDEDLSAYFEGMDGSFVLYDVQSEYYHIYNKEHSVNRVSPNSTYKIYSALMGLEAGVISKEESSQKWDGTIYPYASWNKDQDLESAMKNSVSWYFQEIDKAIGYKKLQTYFDQIHYGNSNLTGGISEYWMESTLRISPVEQVQLLKDFYLEQMAFEPQYIELVKEALKLDEKEGAVLSGKTGTGMINHKQISGWFIGYVEKEGKTFIFATHIKDENNASGSQAAKITLEILKDKNIY